MKHQRNDRNILTLLLLGILLAVVAVGIFLPKHTPSVNIPSHGEDIDLDAIVLEDSGVTVSFSDVILSKPQEQRKLIVAAQDATAEAKLEDKLIEKLDFEILKKSQLVTYTGTGYFVVDLDAITPKDIVTDKDKQTVTIRIPHPYLQAVEIDPNKVVIGEVRESLLARGDIKLTVADYNTIEKQLRENMEQKLNTAENGQLAAANALKMVKETYEPLVKAIDRRYTVVVEYR